MRRVETNLSRHRRRNRGAAAVEFALVGPLFLALVFSNLELGYLFLRRALFENAVFNASKQVYILSNPTQDALIADICDRAVLLGADCIDNVEIELTPVTSYADPPQGAAPCRDSSIAPNPPDPGNYNPGGSGQVVLMRVCASVVLFTPGLGFAAQLPKNAANNYELVAVTAFQNE